MIAFSTKYELFYYFARTFCVNFLQFRESKVIHDDYPGRLTKTKDDAFSGI